MKYLTYLTPPVYTSQVTEGVVIVNERSSVGVRMLQYYNDPITILHYITPPCNFTSNVIKMLPVKRT